MYVYRVYVMQRCAPAPSLCLVPIIISAVCGGLSGAARRRGLDAASIFCDILSTSTLCWPSMPPCVRWLRI